VAETRAILFDLDDTLYPYRAFVRSGFLAVGQRVADEFGLPLSAVVRVMRRALVGGGRGRVIQALCDRFGLSGALVPELIDLLRSHVPHLHLPKESATVLRSLRSGWRIGVLTNGTPAIQRRKIAALGLGGLVDEVLCAEECGAPSGKPAPEVFRTALDRLNVTAARTVFVGDDRQADIDGATAVGMKTIHITVHRPADPPCDGSCHGVHAGRLGLVPELADRLVPARV
jgi:HAD superfamily hydrolase (TIGR01509 family)